VPFAVGDDGAELCCQGGWSLRWLLWVLQLRGPGEVGNLPVQEEFLTLDIGSGFFQYTWVTRELNKMPAGETPAWGTPPGPELLREMQTGSSEYVKRHGRGCELLGIPNCWCEVPIASKTCPQVLC